MRRPQPLRATLHERIDEMIDRKKEVAKNVVGTGSPLTFRTGLSLTRRRGLRPPSPRDGPA